MRGTHHGVFVLAVSNVHIHAAVKKKLDGIDRLLSYFLQVPEDKLERGSLETIPLLVDIRAMVEKHPDHFRVGFRCCHEKRCIDTVGAEVLGIDIGAL